MSKKIYLGILLAFTTLFVIGIPLNAAVLKVPSPYSKIQAAINAASPGDKIEVGPSTYNEFITIDKANLTIQSTAGAANTIIDAGGANKDIVTIIADGVTLDGFTLQNANGVNVAGIRMTGTTLDPVSRCTISNIITKNITGTKCAHGIRSNYVENSIFSNIEISDLTETVPQVSKGDGVFAILLSYTDHSKFTDIRISYLLGDANSQGIMLYSSCDHNEFTNTVISGLTATYDYACGINIWSRDPNPHSDYNTFTTTTIKNVNGSESVYGIQNRALVGNEHTGNRFIDTHISDLTSTDDVVLVIYNEYTIDTKLEDSYISYITAKKAAIGINNAWKYDNTVISGGEIKNLYATYEGSVAISFVRSTSTARVEEMTLSGSDHGVRISGSADACNISVHSNNIEGNTKHGLLNGDYHIVDAENNWWGDSSGPYHIRTNSTGAGNKVSNYVDYTPWLDAPQFHGKSKK